MGDYFYVPDGSTFKKSTKVILPSFFLLEKEMRKVVSINWLLLYFTLKLGMGAFVVKLGMFIKINRILLINKKMRLKDKEDILENCKLFFKCYSSGSQTY